LSCALAKPNAHTAIADKIIFFIIKVCLKLVCQKYIELKRNR
jgi:hypothetical protein